MPNREYTQAEREKTQQQVWEALPEGEISQEHFLFMVSLQCDLNHSTEQLREARELLNAMEWGFQSTRCLICSGWMCSPNGETDHKHTKECALGKWLSLNP